MLNDWPFASKKRAFGGVAAGHGIGIPIGQTMSSKASNAAFISFGATATDSNNPASASGSVASLIIPF
ncbi:hypothetical protein, partial [Bacillus inaquosorum]